MALRADSYCDLLEEAAAHPTEKTQDDIAQFLRLLEVRPTGEAQNLPQPPEDKLLNINMDALTVCFAFALRLFFIYIFIALFIKNVVFRRIFF